MDVGDRVQLLGILLEVAGALWLVAAAWKTRAEVYEAFTTRIGAPTPETEHRWPGVAAARLSNWKGAVGAAFVLVGLVLQGSGLLL